jgi:hypothetical protein
VRALASGEGAEIAEAALVLPLVFMFLLGIVWFGRAFNIYSTITQAAQQGAQAAARPACATCGNLPLPLGLVDAAVGSVMDASSLDKAQIRVSPPSAPVAPCLGLAPAPTCQTTTNNVTVCRSVALNNPPDFQCGSIVSFQYPFQFNVPLTSLGTPILLRAEAHSRMEN